MKKIATIILLSYLFFFLEFTLFNWFGRWGSPQLLIILVVFFNLYSGIRYSLVTAFAAGLIKDCFSLSLLGTHIFAFVVAAYLTTFIRRNLYQRGSVLSRLFVVFAVTVVYVWLIGVIKSMHEEIDFVDMVYYILIPEVTTTVIAAMFVFERLKNLALKLRL